MYAVMVTGGKQYRVMEGETLRVELLPAEVDNEITFGDDVAPALARVVVVALHEPEVELELID
mgnify:CR=1 FL=1